MLRVDCVVATYHGDDFGLDGLIQGDQAEVEGEVELDGILAAHSVMFTCGSGGECAVLSTYGGDEEEDGEGLLSACHDEGREREELTRRISKDGKERGDRFGERRYTRSN